MGNAQNAGDSMHVTTDRYCKNKEVFTENQWGSYIRPACTRKPYEVKHIQQTELKDFSLLAEQFQWKYIRISGVRIITFDPSDKRLVYVKYNYADKPKPAKIFKENINFRSVLTDYELQSAYEQKISRSNKKQKIY